MTDIQEDDENQDTSNIIDLDLSADKKPTLMDIINKASTPVETEKKPFVTNANASALQEAYNEAKNDKYSTLFEAKEQNDAKKSSLPDIKIVSLTFFYCKDNSLFICILFLSYFIYSGLSGLF